MKPVPKFTLLGSLTFVLLLVPWLYYLTLPWYLGGILAMNLIALGFCGYDKAIAGSTYTRVPERVLLGTALLGGSLGLLLGMTWFRHKTQKWSFKWPLVLILVVQCAGIGGFVYYLG